MKKLFRTLGDFFTKLFKGVMGSMRIYVKPAVLIVEALKAAVESPAADVLVQLTKTPVDNVLLMQARRVLPEIFNMMQLTNGCLQAGHTNDEVIQCAIAKIKLYHPNAQKGIWLEIAGHLSAALSDGKFRFSEVVGLAWLIYHKEVKGDM
jgi:hypothetical protein